MFKYQQALKLYSQNVVEKITRKESCDSFESIDFEKRNKKRIDIQDMLRSNTLFNSLDNAMSRKFNILKFGKGNDNN